MRNYRSLIVAFIALAGGLGLAPKSTPPTLKKVAEFDLPGSPGNPHSNARPHPTNL